MHPSINELQGYRKEEPVDSLTVAHEVKAWRDAWRSRLLKLPEFRHKMAVNLSSLGNGRFHSKQISLVFISIGN